MIELVLKAAVWFVRRCDKTCFQAYDTTFRHADAQVCRKASAVRHRLIACGSSRARDRAPCLHGAMSDLSSPRASCTLRADEARECVKLHLTSKFELQHQTWNNSDTESVIAHHEALLCAIAQKTQRLNASAQPCLFETCAGRLQI